MTIAADNLDALYSLVIIGLKYTSVKMSMAVQLNAAIAEV